MENFPQAQDPPKNKINRMRWFAVLIFVLAVISGLFFAGRYIYSLGQRTASQLSGVDLTPHPTITPTVYMTPTIPTMTPTFTLTPSSTPIVMFPTVTPTLVRWASCPGIVITVEDTRKGDIVHVLRCSDNFTWDIGPIAKGFYAVSPDDKYLVYCTVEGILYAAPIGAPTLHTIMNVKRDGEFTVFNKKVTPEFRLTFVGNPPSYVLKIYEFNYNQNMPITMPSWLDE